MKSLTKFLLKENKIKDINRYKDILLKFLHDNSFNDKMFTISLQEFKEGESIVIKFSRKFEDTKIWKLCGDIESILNDNGLDYQFVGFSKNNQKVAILPYEE